MWKQMPVKRNLFSFSEICPKGDRQGVMNEVKALNKNIDVFGKSKNLAQIGHNDVNQNYPTKKKIHLDEKGISKF